MQDSTGKKMEAYKSTMPTQYGVKNDNNLRYGAKDISRASIAAKNDNNTSESYMPKDKNICKDFFVEYIDISFTEIYKEFNEFYQNTNN